MTSLYSDMGKGGGVTAHSLSLTVTLSMYPKIMTIPTYVYTKWLVFHNHNYVLHCVPSCDVCMKYVYILQEPEYMG